MLALAMKFSRSARKSPARGSVSSEGSHPQDRTACPGPIGAPPGFLERRTPDGGTASRAGITSDQPGASGEPRLGGNRSPRRPGPALPMLLRKEVIQPHLPVRLPCYDFTPIAGPTFGSSLQKVGPLTSGVTDFRGVTGGVYKARERIHRGIADPRLLATPTSRGRVADPDPN
jgi:hypothetical protein